MKNYTITVNGTPYNVTVEEGAGAPVAAAPVAAPAAAPAPAGALPAVARAPVALFSPPLSRPATLSPRP